MIRDIILRFMPPKMRVEAEAHSRTWLGRCPHCQSVNSVWDVGGIRYKAFGDKVTLARCPKCRKSGFYRFEKKI